MKVGSTHVLGGRSRGTRHTWLCCRGLAEPSSCSQDGGDQPLVMDNIPIRHRTSVVHQGVELSPDLKFHSHVPTVFRKFQQRVNLLCYMGRHLHHYNITLLYKGAFRLPIKSDQLGKSPR